MDFWYTWNPKIPTNGFDAFWPNMTHNVSVTVKALHVYGTNNRQLLHLRQKTHFNTRSYLQIVPGEPTNPTHFKYFHYLLCHLNFTAWIVNKWCIYRVNYMYLWILFFYVLTIRKMSFYGIDVHAYWMQLCLWIMANEWMMVCVFALSLSKPLPQYN